MPRSKRLQGRTWVLLLETLPWATATTRSRRRRRRRKARSCRRKVSSSLDLKVFHLSANSLLFSPRWRSWIAYWGSVSSRWFSSWLRVYQILRFGTEMGTTAGTDWAGPLQSWTRTRLLSASARRCWTHAWIHFQTKNSSNRSSHTCQLSAGQSNTLIRASGVPRRFRSWYDCDWLFISCTREKL